MASNAPALVVPPPDASAAPTNDIRDIHPPVDIPSGWEWLGWMLAAMALLALLLLGWRWWKYRRWRPVLAPVVPPHVRAKERLRHALALLQQPREFCILVSDTVRVYLEERFAFHAPERTTEEFLLELRGTQRLTPEQKQSLGEFLQSCDLVKFARFEPTEDALRALLDAALRLIDETQYEPVSTTRAGGLSDTDPPSTLPPRAGAHSVTTDRSAMAERPVEAAVSATGEVKPPAS